MKRADGEFLAILGFILWCLSAITAASNIMNEATTLFVGGIIFLVAGYLIIEDHKKKEIKPRKK